jgi:PBP1b-binding outer membrane lipoprotein LpoB
MKKLLSITIISIFFAACNDDKTATPPSAPNTTNVQNVNGNQPDTTTGITLDSRQTSDTSKIRDTTPR